MIYFCSYAVYTRRSLHLMLAIRCLMLPFSSETIKNLFRTNQKLRINTNQKYSILLRWNTHRLPASAVQSQCVWFQLHAEPALFRPQFRRNCCWWLVLRIVTHRLEARPVHWVTSPKPHTLPSPKPMPIWHLTCGRIIHWARPHTKNTPTSWPSTTKPVLHAQKHKHSCFTCTHNKRLFMLWTGKSNNKKTQAMFGE